MATLADSADAGVVTLQRGIGQAETRPSEDPVHVMLDHLPEVLQRLEPLPAKHPVPALEFLGHMGPDAEAPDEIKLLLEDIPLPLTSFPLLLPSFIASSASEPRGRRPGGCPMPMIVLMSRSCC
jgi:hypothetical protein